MTFANASDVMIRPEPTPNPASVRFVLNKPVLEGGTADIKSAETARERSPLAAKLFGLEHVAGVFLGANFVTITAPTVEDWNVLAADAIDVIRAHVAAGEPMLIGGPDAAPEGAESEDEVSQGIIEIIDKEIRPAVAMDGGDIVFDRFEGGVVYLQLRGSCHGCPSSMMTLKMGIERRLQEEFPQVMAVEAV